MKTIAIIVAGGIGARMNQDIPKQFLNVHDKPVLIYTMENFQRHAQVDVIGVVCVEGWHAVVKAYAAQFNMTKFRWVITGGKTVQESIWNGVRKLKDDCADDDIVVIHDGVRPLVDESVLTDVLRVCKLYGNAVPALPYNEQIFRVAEDDPDTSTEYIVRETIRRVSTPQAYRYKLLYDTYTKAFAQGIGIHGSSYTNTMMVELGVRLHFAKGSDKNIKLTTLEDLEIFKAYLDMEKDSWLKRGNRE